MSKTFPLCLASLLVGAGVTFLITRNILEKKYAKLVEEEIASIKEAFERAKLRPKVVREKKPSKEVKDLIEMGEKLGEAVKKGIKNANATLTRSSLDNDPYEKAKRDYHKISSAANTGAEVTDEKTEEPDPEDDTDEDETDDAGMTEKDLLDLTKVDRTQPYIINDKEYADEFSHHDKLSLYYYRVDGTLCEENEEMIDDVDAVIGPEALHVLDTQTTVWVRNEPLGIDYEVIALNSSYAETAHGIHIKPLKQAPPPKRIMTPRERYEEKQKRRESNGE